MSAEKLNPVNPGPLGLLGFGMTTILLNLHNAEIIPLSIVIVAMGLALGGAAQIIAGILEFCHGNTFGGTVFVPSTASPLEIPPPWASICCSGASLACSCSSVP